MPTSCFAFDERAAGIDAVHALTALYTVDPVIEVILNDIHWPTTPGRLLDPSCGNGSFLIRAIARLELTPNDVTPLNRVRGWEFHPGAVADARERITDHLTSRGWESSVARAAARDMVVEADFLTDGPSAGEFDVFVGNPPYLRWTYLPQVLRDVYSSGLPLHAKADVLHAFLDRCCNLLPAHGVMAFVSADRWLFNVNSTGLRSALGTRLAITHLERLDPSSTFQRPKRRSQGTPPRVHPVKIICRVIGANVGGKAITAEPISPDDFLTSSPSETSGTVLEDIATIRLAPWLGGNGVFVIDAATAARLTGAALIPAIDTDNISRTAEAMLPATRFAIFTRPDEEPHEDVKAHILANRHLLAPRARRTKYWLPPETITLPLDREYLLIPRIATRLRAIRIPAGILPINHNLTVVSACSEYGLNDLETILTSEESQTWIRRNAPRLENGFLSITPNLLRRLPIPRRLAKAA